MKAQSRHDDLIALLYGDPAVNCPMDIVNHLGMIDGEDGSTLPLFRRCLTTGTEEAREAVRKHLTSKLATLQDAYDDEETGAVAEDRWDQSCEEMFAPTVTNDVCRIWNTANVIMESGCALSLFEVLYNISYMESLVPEARPSHHGNPMDDSYWRGIAAITVSRCTTAYPLSLDASQFSGYITWAGNHSDISAVIDIARERRTFDRTVLEAVLNTQDRSSPVRGGVL